MRFLNPKVVLFAALLLGLVIPVRSQDLRKQAEEHPLTTVLYLLSTVDKDSKTSEKACLAKSYVRAGRFSACVTHA